MPDERPTRYFVTIFAPDAERLRDLLTRGLDLFATRSDRTGHRADGLIGLDDVGALVDAGYQVHVLDADRPRLQHRFIGAEEWQRAMLADLRRERKGR
jgi:hypothetical protein